MLKLNVLANILQSIMDIEPKDIAPVKDIDAIDRTNIKSIDQALKQATERNSTDLVNNLTEMKRLVESFPGQALVRSNDLLQMEGLTDINDLDLVLHMRNPHKFIYPGDQYGGDKIHDTGKLGNDALPIYSMRHGILLVDPNTTRTDTNTNYRENLFNADLPKALSTVDAVPEKGLKITTHHYRIQPTAENTHDLLYSHVNPRAKVTPLEFIRMSLDPQKAD